MSKSMNHKKNIKLIFDEALNSVLPRNLIKKSFKIKNKMLYVDGLEPIKLDKKIYVFGSGKASIEMAKAVESVIGHQIADGCVISNYPHKNLKKIEVLEGSHPVLDSRTIKATEILMKKMSEMKDDDTFIYLLSGGSSALLEKPIEPITLREMQKTTKALLKQHASIERINTVRKHLSAIKGGKLSLITKARGIVLVISDVVGDNLKTIGSAPLYCDNTTFKDAFQTLKYYEILDDIPEPVLKVIKDGKSGKIPENPLKPRPNIDHIVIGSNMIGLDNAKKTALKLGYNVEILTSSIQGQAKEVAKVIISIGEEMIKSGTPLKPPAILLFGGETTVIVRGKGKGGRNQELCLAALKTIKDNKRFIFLSAGSDGIDGCSNAAGAVVDYKTYKKAEKLNLSIEDYLKNNDSNTLFSKTGGLIYTGITGTNVMDFSILMVI